MSSAVCSVQTIPWAQAPVAEQWSSVRGSFFRACRASKANFAKVDQSEK